MPVLGAIALSSLSSTGIESSKTEASGIDFQSIVEKVAETVDKNYVFADLGKEVSDTLLELNNDEGYRWSSDPDAFASQLTDVLQNLTHDKHMRVRWYDARSEDKKVQKRIRITPEKDNYGIHRVERLDYNIFYVVLTDFTKTAVRLLLSRPS